MLVAQKGGRRPHEYSEPTNFAFVPLITSFNLVCVMLYKCFQIGADATIQQFAIANQIQKLEGELAALKYKVKEKIRELVLSDMVSPFYILILDYLEGERKLVNVTAATFKNLRNKNLTLKQWQYVYETLNYIALFVMRNTQDKMFGKTVAQCRQIMLQDNSKVVDLNEIISLIKKDFHLYSDASLLENLDYTFEQGWATNTLKQVWNQREKLEFDSNKLNKFVIGASGESKISKAVSSVTKPAVVSSAKSGDKSENFKSGTPLWDKDQIVDRECRPAFNPKTRQYSLPGTVLLMEKDECVNLNLWGTCLNSRCTKKQRCIVCKDESHGAIHCPTIVFKNYSKRRK